MTAVSNIIKTKWGYVRLTYPVKATEVCYYCESEHTRKQSSYCCSGCEKAQQKQDEFDNN